MGVSQELMVNGWLLYAHPIFISQYKKLITDVDAHFRRDAVHYKTKKVTKILAAVQKLILHEIPTDPTSQKYKQGGTLGDQHKHWFRAKFFQQYRLFFRYHKECKIIIYAWVNDEDTKRAYDSKTDAYVIFRKMLNNGHPPSDWSLLLKEARGVSSLDI